MTPSPRRVYTKIVLAVFGFVAVLDALLLGLGFVSTDSLRSLAIAGVALLVGICAWEVVERYRWDDGGAGAAAWVALPVAMAAGFLALPFLALSVCPSLEGFLKSGRHVRLIAREGPNGEAVLEIEFPAPTRGYGRNLLFDQKPLPEAALDSASGVLRWEGPQRLLIDLDALEKLGGTGTPRQVGINVTPDAPRFVFRTGVPVPGQTVAPAW